MSKETVLGYIMTVISFFGTIFAIIKQPSGGIVVFLICCTIFFVLIFGYLLLSEKNKMSTLQVLAKENRRLTLRLLLIHKWLQYGEGKRINEFRLSKLRVSTARYKYKFERVSPDGDVFDMQCNFQFDIMPSLFSRCFLKDFDIMIMQPSGSHIDSICYSFDCEDQTYAATTSTVHTSVEGTDTPELLKVRIPFNGRRKVHHLTISYTMPEVDRINAAKLGKTIVICPFFYAKRIKQIELSVEYSENTGYRPGAVCLKKYPYDGRHYAPERLLDFESENNSMIWKGSPKSHAAQAVYVIEMHHPIKC